MSGAAIQQTIGKCLEVNELPMHTPEERVEIRLRLEELDGEEWLDSDDPLSDKEKALLEARLDDLGKQPEKSISW